MCNPRCNESNRNRRSSIKRVPVAWHGYHGVSTPLQTDSPSRFTMLPYQLERSRETVYCGERKGCFGYEGFSRFAPITRPLDSVSDSVFLREKLNSTSEVEGVDTLPSSVQCQCQLRVMEVVTAHSPLMLTLRRQRRVRRSRKCELLFDGKLYFRNECEIIVPKMCKF